MNKTTLNIISCEKTAELAPYFAIHINKQEAEFHHCCLTDRCRGGVYRVANETIELSTLEDASDLYALCSFQVCPYELHRRTKRLTECEHATVTIRVLREIGKG